MPLRNFQDSEGNDWRVWDVVPYGGRNVERRGGDRRRIPPRPYAGPERRGTRDRRMRTPTLLTPGLESGWLCFENPADKRRLTPIPPGWESVPNPELERLLREARSVARRAS